MAHFTNDDHVPAGVDRRGFLRRGAMVAGVGAVLPLVGFGGFGTASAAPVPGTAGNTDPDALFTAGEFAAAERGYRALLHQNPGDAHATAQLGYIALLSNRFRGAEFYLTEALRLSPGDMPSKQRLADCYVRQDMLARAVPLLPPPAAAQLAAVAGTPYEVRGPLVSRVPFIDVDPLPHIEASVNGVASGQFILDTGAATPTLTLETATKAGLRAVSTSTAFLGGQEVVLYLAVADSLRIGEMELRNIPVSWTDQPGRPLPNGVVPAGVIGTTTFYHFLTTMDYRGRELVLRRKTPGHARTFQAEAALAGIRPQPLWLAGDHFPCTLGKLNDYGPRVACMDTGGMGVGLNTSAANAQQAGIIIDYADPIPIGGGAVAYPIAPDRMSIGDAVGRHVPGSVGPTGWEDMIHFDTIGNFTHEFFKPFAVTFDFVGMNLYVG